MPDVAWNARIWGDNSNWQQAGDEWSGDWGNSEAQWFGCLYPRIHRFLPAARVLEIAPGFGRWSSYLIPLCSRYLGIDLNQNCVDGCRERFAGAPRARFAANDGLHLDAAEDGLYDFVFSFDSLVHCELDVLESYIPQIIRKLSADGVAFLHHSNLAAAGPLGGMPSHARAGSVSAAAVEELIERHGGSLMIQEIISWNHTGLIDCLTTFRRHRPDRPADPIKLVNPSFKEEAILIRSFQSAYSRVGVF
jgi:SAM-dependent methyltransferase